MNNSLQYLKLSMVSLPVAISLYVSLSYVVALHISFKGINDYKMRRDDPRVIKSRMKRVLGVTLINIVLIPWFHAIYSQGECNFIEAFLRLGLIPGILYGQGILRFAWGLFFSSVVNCLKLMCILYCGPLLDNLLYYLLVPGVSVKSMFIDVYNELFNIWGLRNYVFAPLTEELFYTAMIINNYLITDQKSTTFNSVIFLSPLFFGVAHVHHGFEMYSIGLYSTLNILFSVLFQTVYTTAFGIFTNYVFVRTGGNLWCCIFLHAMANYLGFPGGSELSSQLHIVQHKCSRLVIVFGALWKWIYIGLLLVGVAEFKNNLWNLTQSPYELRITRSAQ